MSENNFPLALSFDDVLLTPKYSNLKSRSEVDLSTKLSEKISLKIPLISANVETVTGVKMAIAMGKLGGLGILPRFETPKKSAEKIKQIKEGGVLAGVSVGTKPDEKQRAKLAVEAGADILNVDVAHGHLQIALDTTAYLKEKYGNKVTIFGGIVATAEGAKAQYEAGADVVTVGVGSGSICTTRIQTGSGVPLLQSLFDIAPVAKRYNKTFIPVAGIRNSGDMVKALATGASAIWGGYVFSATNEAPGEVIKIKGEKYKKYSGSTSKKEKIKQIKNYSNGKNKEYVYHIEGVEGLVPYRGELKSIVKHYLAGIKSGCSYSGARNIKELKKYAEFIRITPGGLKESKAHNIIQI